MGSIPGSGRYPGEGNSYPLQYSCLGNSMDRGVWRATVSGGHKRARHDLAIEHTAYKISTCDLGMGQGETQFRP